MNNNDRDIYFGSHFFELARIGPVKIGIQEEQGSKTYYWHGCTRSRSYWPWQLFTIKYMYMTSIKVLFEFIIRQNIFHNKISGKISKYMEFPNIFSQMLKNLTSYFEGFRANTLMHVRSHERILKRSPQTHPLSEVRVTAVIGSSRMAFWVSTFGDGNFCF